MSKTIENRQMGLSSEVVDAFALGVQKGLGLAGDPCAANGACPPVSATDAPTDQRPLGDDDELAAADRDLSGSDLDGSDE